MSQTDLLHHELTGEIIGSAVEVHSSLGTGFLESVYEEALAIEFDIRNVPYERQRAINVLYKERQAKQFICDVLVAENVLVEIKAVSQLTRVEHAQLMNYLKATGIRVGLLINFGERSLKYKRFIL